MTKLTRVVVASLVALLATSLLTTSARAARVPVLGAKTYVVHGVGWGTRHPHKIFNGGDPSGLVTHLTWQHWGGPTARGRGITSISKPGGGYYAKPGRIVLRASLLSQCPDATRPAYTALFYRVAKKPGGRLQKHWHPWGGEPGSICSLAG